MSDDLLVKPLVGTAHFSKKVSDGNYGSEEAGFFVQFDYAPGAPDTEIASLAADALAVAKRTTVQSLGATSQVLGAPTAPVDAVLGAFPGAHVEAPPFPVATAPTPQAYAPAPSAPAAPSGGQPASCNKCGGTAFFDNRAKKAAGEYKPNAPDFKCSNKPCSAGVWSK